MEEKIKLVFFQKHITIVRKDIATGNFFIVMISDSLKWIHIQ